MTNFIRKCVTTTSATADGGIGSSGGGLQITSGTRQISLRTRFKVTQRTTQSPGVASIFITNPATSTVKTALSLTENQTIVTLQAGYEDGLFGTIFKGTIRQVRVGKDNPTDTYIN